MTLAPAAPLWAFLPIAGLVGLAIGSFLNVVIYRVPRGESPVRPPSACPACGALLRGRDLVPVASWLVLRGRCRSCRAAISVRYPLVEAATAALFILVAWRFQDRPGLIAAYGIFAAVSVALACIDLDVRRLPNVIVLPAYPVLLLLLLLDDAPGRAERLADAALAAAILTSFYVLIVVMAPGSMGMGDVKLAGIVGGLTGYLSWGAFLVGALGAFVLGSLAGLVLIASRRADRRTAVPFGPFMVLAAWASILGGSGLGEAYLRSL